MKHYVLEDQKDGVFSAENELPVSFARMAYHAIGKRVLDLALAIPLTVLILPIILVLALIVSRDGGSVFFGHRRVGKDGKVFKCWKIRTMVVDAERKLWEHLEKNPAAAEEWLRDHKLVNDPRTTRIGRILRKTSLDELPQIWNVLRGDMSFVGPRPIVRMELAKYGTHRYTYTSVRPGVTGLWQVSGRNDISYAERVQLDVDYVRSVSLLLDLKLIFKTASVVLGGTGK